MLNSRRPYDGLTRRAVLAGLVAVSCWAVDPAFAQKDPGGRFEAVFVGSTASHLKVDNAVFSQAGALPRGDVKVTNSTSRERRFEYKVEWFAQSGGSAQTASTWRSIVLAPMESQGLVFIGQVEIGLSGSADLARDIDAGAEQLAWEGARPRRYLQAAWL